MSESSRNADAMPPPSKRINVPPCQSFNELLIAANATQVERNGSEQWAPINSHASNGGIIGRSGSESHDHHDANHRANEYQARVQRDDDCHESNGQSKKMEMVTDAFKPNNKRKGPNSSSSITANHKRHVRNDAKGGRPSSHRKPVKEQTFTHSHQSSQPARSSAPPIPGLTYRSPHASSRHLPTTGGSASHSEPSHHPYSGPSHGQSGPSHGHPGTPEGHGMPHPSGVHLVPPGATHVHPGTPVQYLQPPASQPSAPVAYSMAPMQMQSYHPAPVVMQPSPAGYVVDHHSPHNYPAQMGPRPVTMWQPPTPHPPAGGHHMYPPPGMHAGVPPGGAAPNAHGGVAYAISPSARDGPGHPVAAATTHHHTQGGPSSKYATDDGGAFDEEEATNQANPRMGSDDRRGSSDSASGVSSTYDASRMVQWYRKDDDAPDLCPLYDQHGARIAEPTIQAWVEKGAKWDNEYQAFIFQKKNHFQVSITVTGLPSSESRPVYIQHSEPVMIDHSKETRQYENSVIPGEDHHAQSNSDDSHGRGNAYGKRVSQMATYSHKVCCYLDPAGGHVDARHVGFPRGREALLQMSHNRFPRTTICLYDTLYTVGCIRMYLGEGLCTKTPYTVAHMLPECLQSLTHFFAGFSSIVMPGVGSNVQRSPLMPGVCLSVQVSDIDWFAHLYAVKMESTRSAVRLQQGLSDRSKVDYDYEPLHRGQKPDEFKAVAGKLHFEEPTGNNARRYNRINPEQKYFALVVALVARVGQTYHKVASIMSDRVVVRSSHPKQFGPNPTIPRATADKQQAHHTPPSNPTPPPTVMAPAPTWTPGTVPNTLTYNGRVGVGVVNPAEALQVHGNLLLAGNILQLSDARVKENIVRQPSDAHHMARLREVQLCTFNYTDSIRKHPRATDDGSARSAPKRRREQLGVVAQELYKVIPEAVHVLDTPGGKPSSLPSQALAVDKDRLLFECIGALKHLDAQNRELHARLRRLEDEKN
eukprot:m.869148 g.869148  ORF g.869148 m.869148 type:complete len:984 (-) comp23563_c2_seq60:936-3887(-)